MYRVCDWQRVAGRRMDGEAGDGRGRRSRINWHSFFLLLSCSGWGHVSMAGSPPSLYCVQITVHTVLYYNIHVTASFVLPGQIQSAFISWTEVKQHIRVRSRDMKHNTKNT